MNTHLTLPTEFVEANGIRFAYRRFGKIGGVPPPSIWKQVFAWMSPIRTEPRLSAQ